MLEYLKCLIHKRNDGEADVSSSENRLFEAAASATAAAAAAAASATTKVLSALLIGK